MELESEEKANKSNIQKYFIYDYVCVPELV